MTALVLGVDPGRKGAVALIDPDGTTFTFTGRELAAMLKEEG